MGAPTAKSAALSSLSTNVARAALVVFDVSYRPPGATLPVSAVTCQALAALADRYCTLRPETSTAALPPLPSSTKSWASGAPELPPPP